MKAWFLYTNIFQRFRSFVITENMINDQWTKEPRVYSLMRLNSFEASIGTPDSYFGTIRNSTAILTKVFLIFLIVTNMRPVVTRD
jgi:hypothetical protein